MSYSGDIVVGSVGTQLYLEYLFVQHFPVNFHFLKNDKSYNQDLFYHRYYLGWAIFLWY